MKMQLDKIFLSGNMNQLYEMIDIIKWTVAGAEIAALRLLLA